MTWDKWARAVKDGRVLRDRDGRFVVPEVVKPGVVIRMEQR